MSIQSATPNLLPNSKQRATVGAQRARRLFSHLNQKPFNTKNFNALATSIKESASSMGIKDQFSSRDTGRKNSLQTLAETLSSIAKTGWSNNEKLNYCLTIIENLTADQKKEWIVLTEYYDGFNVAITLPDDERVTDCKVDYEQYRRLQHTDKSLHNRLIAFIKSTATDSTFSSNYNRGLFILLQLQHSDLQQSQELFTSLSEILNICSYEECMRIVNDIGHYMLESTIVMPGLLSLKNKPAIVAATKIMVALLAFQANGNKLLTLPNNTKLLPSTKNLSLQILEEDSIVQAITFLEQDQDSTALYNLFNYHIKSNNKEELYSDKIFQCLLSNLEHMTPTQRNKLLEQIIPKLSSQQLCSLINQGKCLTTFVGNNDSLYGLISARKDFNDIFNTQLNFIDTLCYWLPIILYNTNMNLNDNCKHIKTAYTNINDITTKLNDNTIAQEIRSAYLSLAIRNKGWKCIKIPIDLTLNDYDKTYLYSKIHTLVTDKQLSHITIIEEIAKALGLCVDYGAFSNNALRKIILNNLACLIESTSKNDLAKQQICDILTSQLMYDSNIGNKHFLFNQAKVKDLLQERCQTVKDDNNLNSLRMLVLYNQVWPITTITDADKIVYLKEVFTVQQLHTLTPEYKKQLALFINNMFNFLNKEPDETQYSALIQALLSTLSNLLDGYSQKIYDDKNVIDYQSLSHVVTYYLTQSQDLQENNSKSNALAFVLATSRARGYYCDAKQSEVQDAALCGCSEFIINNIASISTGILIMLHQNLQTLYLEQLATGGYVRLEAKTVLVELLKREGLTDIQIKDLKINLKITITDVIQNEVNEHLITRYINMLVESGDQHKINAALMELRVQFTESDNGIINNQEIEWDDQKIQQLLTTLSKPAQLYYQLQTAYLASLTTNFSKQTIPYQTVNAKNNTIPGRILECIANNDINHNLAKFMYIFISDADNSMVAIPQEIYKAITTKPSEDTSTSLVTIKGIYCDNNLNVDNIRTAQFADGQKLVQYLGKAPSYKLLIDHHQKQVDATETENLKAVVDILLIHNREEDGSNVEKQEVIKTLYGAITSTTPTNCIPIAGWIETEGKNTIEKIAPVSNAWNPFNPAIKDAHVPRPKGPKPNQSIMQHGTAEEKRNYGNWFTEKNEYDAVIASKLHKHRLIKQQTLDQLFTLYLLIGTTDETKALALLQLACIFAKLGSNNYSSNMTWNAATKKWNNDIHNNVHTGSSIDAFRKLAIAFIMTAINYCPKLMAHCDNVYHSNESWLLHIQHTLQTGECMSVASKRVYDLLNQSYKDKIMKMPCPIFSRTHNTVGFKPF